jgi:enhancing lycopene biosynthesis protein 2
VDCIVVDPDNLIVTTPAYMLGPSIAKVGLGIEKLVDEVMKLVGK